MAVEHAPRPFTVHEYHRMAAAGILGPDERVELLGGVVVEMTPIGPRHADTVDRLSRLFFDGIGVRGVVRVQNPVVLDDLWEPQPDLAIARSRTGGYAFAHPGPGDLLLVVEVAETSSDPDHTKIRRFGLAGVPEAWLVDLPNDRIDIYRAPGPEGYGDRRAATTADTICPQAFPDVPLDVGEIIGSVDA